MAKNCYTREQIEAAVKAKGYKWFDDTNNKGYDVNIVGVRNDDTGNQVTNKFDDCVTISYKKNAVNGNFSVFQLLQTQEMIGWKTRG